MFDKGLLPVDEFAKKLINQGMILGTSAFVYRIGPAVTIKSHSKDIRIDDFKLPHFIVSKESYEKALKGEYDDNVKETFNKAKAIWESNGFEVEPDFEKITFAPIHADVSMVNASDELDLEVFKKWRPEFEDAIFIIEKDGTYKVGREPEKMSKSKYNVVNPDEICAQYGADSLRLYEMFLGPLEQYKPWNTAGITGVHSFLKKLWKLYVGEDGLKVTDNEATKDNLKTLHKTIKKVEDDIENFSFNTSVSTFMIAVNELTAQKCTSREILEPLLILVSPYAPHIAEELWNKLGHKESISTAPFPKYEEKHVKENSKNYPVSFNGKMRFTLELPLDMSKEDIEKTVLTHEKTQEQLQGRTPKKVIVVPGKIVNIVG